MEEKEKKQMLANARRDGYSETVMNLLAQREALWNEAKELQKRTNEAEERALDTLRLIDELFEDMKTDGRVKDVIICRENASIYRMCIVCRDRFIVIRQDCSYDSIQYRIRIQEETVNVCKDGRERGKADM